MRLRFSLTTLIALATGLVGLGSAHGPASADGSGERRYDGSLAGFQAFVERHGKRWPLPAEISTFKGKDGASLRYARWTAPDPDRRAGVVVFFQGRTEFIEKNIYAYQDLLDRNYDVWTLDWRGQGLSDRLLTDEPEKGHIDSYRTYLADAEVFVQDVVGLEDIEDGDKILLAHSMGGTIGALYMLRHPGQFDKAVFSSPLIRLPSHVDSRLIRAGNWAKIAVAPWACAGIFTDCLWRSEFENGTDVCALAGDAPSARLIDRTNTARYSRDFQKIAEIECWIADNRAPISNPAVSNPAAPTLGLGGPTSGWLRAMYYATDRIVDNKQNLETPLLIVGGGRDTIVSNAGQAGFCDAGNPQCCRLELAEAGHELLIESESLKKQFFEAFDAFIDSDGSPEEFCAVHG